MLGFSLLLVTPRDILTMSQILVLLTAINSLIHFLQPEIMPGIFDTLIKIPYAIHADGCFVY